MRMMKNILTIDVEDYFQVEAFSDTIPRSAWEEMECRVEESTRRLLRIFEDGGVQATFFVLGWVAERYPALIREVTEAGHEIASHGYGHEMVDRLGAGKFREDLRRSKGVLEDVCGTRVLGYRAPTFSISPRTPWAWEILADEGFEYDSSTFPVRHDRYGDPRGRRFAHVHELAGGKRGVVELPLTTLRVFGTNIPAAGGGYLRLFPLAVVRAAIRQSNRAGHPAVIYLHPWEVDPDQPRVAAPWLRRFRHRINLRRTSAKMRALLHSAEFGPAREYVARLRCSPGDEKPAAAPGRPRPEKVAAGHESSGWGG
jgi:polysaccharide deacetylase family protein (PEP-CTERM system associated)